MKNIDAAILQSFDVKNRGQKVGEFRVDFWIEADCQKTSKFDQKTSKVDQKISKFDQKTSNNTSNETSNVGLNCTISIGQENDGRPTLKKVVGDIFDGRLNSPTHFAFLPGDASSELTIGKIY
jgi:hypothetical protein